MRMSVRWRDPSPRPTTAVAIAGVVVDRVRGGASLAPDADGTTAAMMARCRCWEGETDDAPAAAVARHLPSARALTLLLLLLLLLVCADDAAFDLRCAPPVAFVAIEDPRNRQLHPEIARPPLRLLLVLLPRSESPSSSSWRYRTEWASRSPSIPRRRPPTRGTTSSRTASGRPPSTPCRTSRTRRGQGSGPRSSSLMTAAAAGSAIPRRRKVNPATETPPTSTPRNLPP